MHTLIITKKNVFFDYIIVNQGNEVVNCTRKISMTVCFHTEVLLLVNSETVQLKVTKVHVLCMFMCNEILCKSTFTFSCKATA